MGARFACASLLTAVFACALAVPAGAATFTVDSLVDESDAAPTDFVCRTAANECTLRAAIQSANGNSVGTPDEIILPAGTYSLTRPGVAEDAALTGDLDIGGPVTIRGGGARGTVVDQAVAGERVIDVRSGTVELRGLTVRGGEGGFGAGIRNATTLTIADSAVVDNEGADGAGIRSSGTLTVFRSLLARNLAGGDGGAIVNVSGSVDITNTTLSGNGGENGAALYDASTGPASSIAYSTIAGNSSPGSVLYDVDGANVTVRDSIVANPAPGCTSPSLFVSGGNNIEDGTSCGFTGPTDRQNTDPRLDGLANNGGPTDTHALLAGSPAFDASPAGRSCPATDQRGLPRPIFAACDIGAFERQQQPAPPPPSPPPPPAQAFPASLTLDPARARRRPGDDNVVTAVARNNDGTPAASRVVRYVISGPNDGGGTATTDAAGVARIAWDGVREGTDALSAYVDSNASTGHDPGEPSARASVVWALPLPQQGKTVNIEPISGVVRIRIPARRPPGRSRVAPARTAVLSEARRVPLRTVVDTRRGRVQVSSFVRSIRSVQRGEFYGGVFTTRQPRSGRRPFTELRMSEQLRCPRSRGSAVRTSRARTRRLWGRVRRRGRFRTRGRYSTAAVRGTTWMQKDTCKGTLTVVREGVVVVRDFARRKNVRVKAGRRYVARRAKRRR